MRKGKCKISIFDKSTDNREFSTLNSELFNKAREILNENVQSPNGGGYMGLCGVSAFIDYLEDNYDIKEKVDGT